MKPSIPNPCSQSWDDMKIGLVSRHCDSCRKDVMDFTRMQRHEILEYLIENRELEVCGHIFRWQLDYKHEEIVAVIRDLEQKHRNTNLSFYLLTMATLSLLSCESENTKQHSVQKQVAQTENFRGRRLGGGENRPCEPVEKAMPESEWASQDLVDGGIYIVAPQYIEQQVLEEQVVMEVPRMMAEVMPEFKGGTEALMSYVKENLKYPRWEKKRKIEGTVYATFVVDENGKVKNPHILKSVPEAKHFDREVLRLIEHMPDWTSGSEKGVNTSIQFNMPFKFEL